MRVFGSTTRFENAFSLGHYLRQAQLNLPVRRTKDAPHTRGSLAVASIYDGGSRSDANRLGNITLQIVGDWVTHFNERGPEGPIKGLAKARQPTLALFVHRAQRMEQWILTTGEPQRFANPTSQI